MPVRDVLSGEKIKEVVEPLRGSEWRIFNGRLLGDGRASPDRRPSEDSFMDAPPD